MRPTLEAIFEKYGQEAFFAEVETQAEDKQVGLYTIFVHNQNGSTFFLLKPTAGQKMPLNDKYDTLVSVLDSNNEICFSNKIKGVTQTGAKLT